MGLRESLMTDTQEIVRLLKSIDMGINILTFLLGIVAGLLVGRRRDG